MAGTEDQGATPAVTDNTGTIQPVAPPPAAPEPAPSTLKTALSLDNLPAEIKELVVDGEGKKWRDKFHGREGSLAAAVRTELGGKVAGLEGEIATLKVTLGEKDVAIATKEVSIGELQTQALQAQANADAVQEKANHADKLTIFLGFPKLVATQVAMEVPGAEGEEPTTVMTNPYLDLVGSTQLKGEELSSFFAKLELAIPSQAPPEAPQGAPASAVTSVPTVPSPSGVKQDRLTGLAKQRDTLAQTMKTSSEQTPENWAEFNRIVDEIREIQKQN